jgi:hypothetical protein
MADGGTSPGSATGLPAPNAGVVGSAPTFNVGEKRRRKRRRSRVTKTAADARHRMFLGHLTQILRHADVAKDKVTIGASGYLGLMGLKRTTDLDVWAERDAYTRIAKIPSAETGTALSGSPVVKFRTPMGAIEFFTGPWSVAGHDYGGHRNTVVVDGYRHWNKKKTLAWKQAMGRDKDMVDIRLLEKASAFQAGAMDKMAKVRWGRVIGGGVAAGSGILAIYDLVKARGHAKDLKYVQDAIGGGKRVDSRAFVRKIDPKIKVLWRKDEIYQALSREPSLSKSQARMASGMVAEAVSTNSNAFALPGERGAYIFAPQSTNAQILAHEVGHILDFRAKGLSIKNQGPYTSSLSQIFWKPSYESQVMEAERRAWHMAPGRKSSTELERSALGTYDKSFHMTRGTISGGTAVAIAAMLAKTGAQTTGEYEAAVSAPGVSGMGPAPVQMSGRMERGAGNQGSRGVPEWLRVLKHLPSKKTWNGGDKSGPRPSDNQLSTPQAAEDPRS